MRTDSRGPLIGTMTLCFCSSIGLKVDSSKIVKPDRTMNRGAPRFTEPGPIVLDFVQVPMVCTVTTVPIPRPGNDESIRLDAIGT